MAIMIARDLMRELVTPEPDGVNRIFWTSVEYFSGTVSVWKNGVRLVPGWDTGYEELGSRQIQMKEAPLTGDSLSVQYEVP